MSTATLVLQSYGRPAEHRRGVFSVLSFFAHTQLPMNQVRALIFTDQPDFFRTFLKEFPVEYVLLDSELLRSMRGEIDFVHRVKICVIDEAMKRVHSRLLYVDSDTCFIANPDPVVEEINERQVVMHVFEYLFSQLPEFPLPAGKPMHEFHNLIRTRSFRLNSGEMLRVDLQQPSWNAGVIGLHPKHHFLLNDVYLLTDQFYPTTRHHGSEQYAFDIVLGRNANVVTAEKAVFHYWPVAEKKIADIFLAARITDAWAACDASMKTKAIRLWSEMLPGFIANHGLKFKEQAIYAFNRNEFSKGWHFGFRAMIRGVIDATFLKDMFYHGRRQICKS